MIFVIPLLVCLFHWTTLDGNIDSVWSQIFLCLSLFSIVIAYNLAKRIHWSVFLPVASTLLHFCFYGFGRFSLIDEFNRFTRPGIKLGVFFSGAAFLFYILFFSQLQRKHLKHLIAGLSLAVIADAFYVIYQWVAGYNENTRGGFLGYPGMNGCFMAMGLPLIMNLTPRFLRYILISAIVLAVSLSNSSVPFGVLAVVLGAWFFVSKIRYKKLIASVSLVGALIGGYFVLGDTLLDDSSRLITYREYLKFWASDEYRIQGTHTIIASQPLQMIFGWGNGTFISYGPMIQRETGAGMTFEQGMAIGTVFWAHSDWLQLLFEQGIVGLMGVLIMYFLALKRSYRMTNKSVFVGLLAFAACALLDYPAHLAPTSILGMTLILFALRKEPVHH